MPAPALAAPPAPTGLTAMAQDNRVVLAWQPAAGATGYTVYRGTSPTTITTPITLTGFAPPDLTAPSFRDTTALNGTTYYYAVRATALGQESPNSLATQATPRPRGCVDGNPVTVENCYPGNSGWTVGSGTPTIEGFATASSINKGQSVALKISSSVKFDIEVYRSGYYGGQGARLFSVMRDVPASSQPACVSTASTGMLDCSNWNVTQTLSTTSAWPSGVYLLRLVRRDTGADNQILLVVRDDDRPSDVLYGIPFSTYQAYNNWGGKSTYGWNSTGGTALKVSFDRPYSGPKDANPVAKDWYTRSDSAWVSWLERSGYDVSYASVTDLERRPVGTHAAYISGAHDEYWSSGMRAAVTNARDAGTNVLFAGANAAYWRVRFEPGPTGAQDRVMTVYKTIQTGVTDPVTSTSTWRDPAGPNQPENALLGGQYIGDNSGAAFPLRVSAAQGADRVWRFAGITSAVSIGTSIVGWEWDARTSNGLEPPGTVTVAASNVSGNILQNAGSVYATGSGTANTTRYTAASGALVFATGTNQWGWGLANTAAGTGEPDARIRQATTNVLADMAALPETPISGMQFDDPAAAPLVTRRTPSPNTFGVGTAAAVRAAFSRAMDPSTLTTATFTVQKADGTPVAGAVTYDPATFVASFTPSARLTNDTSYTARLDSTIKAANGIALGKTVSWTFSTSPPDTDPPGVAITAPAAGDTVTGVAAITANASDDQAVESVQFRIDGVDFGAPDTSAPYSVPWDVRTLTAGPRVLTAVARDTAGNTSTSDAVNVVVDPTGIVAAYSFEEPSGSTVTDVSAKGNTGTLVNATRTASGRYGAALQFNGTNASVSIPDSASLDLTNAMTIEAWVNPTAITNWRTIVLKEATNEFSYALYGNADTSAPSAFIFSGGAERVTRGTAPLALNAWTHVAETYDGTTLRLFVNGIQVSSLAISGAITTSNGVLRIGGNGIWGEYFAGKIDEVRLYKRALSATDIQSDMATPLTPLAPDTTAPSAPTAVNATGSMGRVQLSWTASTDNVGVTRYNVHRSTTSGFTPSAGNRVGQPTGTSFDDSGLAPGTYYYRVTAEDAAGNVSAASAQVSGTSTADTTAPTVAVSAPANGATVGGATVNVTATASDDVGVAGVQFKLDGANLGAEDTSSPYAVVWNASTASAGAHTLTAVARDAAGNATTSSTVTVTVDNTAPVVPAGLVAAYPFEEPSGATVNDVSGSGNVGTIGNATRTAAGKNGAALSFNGTNAKVTIPAAPSLALSTGVTMEAWVNPAATMGTTWRTALMKERAGGLSYGLYVNTNTSRPSGHVDTGAETDTRGTAAVAVNVWTHLATTYDGITLRFYVNGTQVSSKPWSGAVLIDNGPLELGGNAVWGEYFSGKLDDVRVYNRALSAAEVAADMNRAAP